MIRRIDERVRRVARGDHLPLNQVLGPKPGLWILLSGCAATEGGSGLVVGIEVEPL